MPWQPLTDSPVLKNENILNQLPVGPAVYPPRPLTLLTLALGSCARAHPLVQGPAQRRRERRRTSALCHSEDASNPPDMVRTAWKMSAVHGSSAAAAAISDIMSGPNG